MPYIFLIAIGSSALAAGLSIAKKRSRTTLVDVLAAPRPSTADLDRPTLGPGPLASVRARLVRWDEKYQTLVQTHLDPWLAGRLRDRQIHSLESGGQRHLSAMELRTNRSLGLGVASLGLIGLAGLTHWPLIPGVIAIGFYNAWPGFQEAWRIAVEERRLSVLHMLPFYLAGMWLGGYFLAGTVGLVFFGICQKIEFLTQQTTRHALTHLLGEQPQRVWVVMDDVEIEIPFEQLRLGDILVLTAGQPIPVDGVVVQGMATVDQHRLTGESQPLEKAVGDTVLAATLVLGGRIQVRVEKTGEETAAGRIGEILNRTVEYQEVKLADQFRRMEHTLIPMLAGGALGWIVGGPLTASAMLGCNYVLFSLLPLQMLGMLNGLKTSARHGILIKDGRALERLPEVDTVVFDKTGTLTLEQPQVVNIHCCAGYAEAGVLACAAAAEQRQNHPIAQAILAAAAQRQLDIPPLDEAHYELGYGLTAQIQGQIVRIGSERFLAMENLELPAGLRLAQDAAHVIGNTLVFVAVGDEVLGAIELAATLRTEAKATIDWLRQQGLALYILSGDQDAPTAKLAAELGMDGYFANTLPTQKAERVQELQARGRRVCFIGDGINDAIALRQAEVSISLRGATTVATDAAQVVLMDDDLAQLRVLWHLAKGFDRAIVTNTKLTQRFSLLAAGGVLAFPALKFWIVELLWGVQFSVGMGIANRPLLGVEPEVEQAVNKAVFTQP